MVHILAGSSYHNVPGMLRNLIYLRHLFTSTAVSILIFNDLFSFARLQRVLIYHCKLIYRKIRLDVFFYHAAADLIDNNR